jgi:hypothetical protein
MNTLKIKIAPRKIVATISLFSMLMTQSLFGIVNLIPVASAQSDSGTELTVATIA